MRCGRKARRRARSPLHLQGPPRRSGATTPLWGGEERTPTHAAVEESDPPDAPGSIARIAALRSATPSFATPAEMWRRTVIGESDRSPLISAEVSPEPSILRI